MNLEWLTGRDIVIGSLFSGTGGLDHGTTGALLAHGARSVRVAWVADIDPGASRILAHRYPGVPNLGDITAVDWTAVEPVDVVTGGFPCQDVSLAGARAGLRPDTRSGLWSQMAYAVSILRPQLVVAENVRGLLSAPAHSDVEPCPWCLGDTDVEPPVRALGALLADMARIGYDARWLGLHASDVGAPHARFRVFVVAHPGPDVGGRGRAPVADTDSTRHGSVGRVDTGQRDTDGRDRQDADGHPDEPETRFGAYGPAITRWTHIVGRPAPDPTIGGRLSPRFVEWMMGLPDGWVTDVPELKRNDMLKALGNGVVPQQAERALQVLLSAGRAS